MKQTWFTWAATWMAVLLIAALVGVFQNATTNQRWLTFAAAILILTSVLHSLLGERFVLQPLSRRGDLPILFRDQHFLLRTLRFVWHLFTIALLGFAALLIAMVAETSAGAIARIISVTALSSAVVAGAVSRGRHLSWVAFLSVGIATWLAAE